ncbi:MAG: ATP-binding protein [bacterium]
MKFYNRVPELALLERMFSQAEQSGKMTVITGRRRVGKTMLSLESVKNKKFLYLFVSKKSEQLLAQDFLVEIKKTFDFPIIGAFKTISQIFELLFEIGKKEKFTLIIDEFQDFMNINSSIYGEIQKLWDLNKFNVKMHIVFSGSVYSVMTKLFEHSKEPLFGRTDRIIVLQPFSIKTIWEVLNDYGVNDYRTLTDFYIITGGIPKYIDLLVTNKAFSLNSIIDFICQEYSPFLNEGKNLLIEEFGKEYSTYFSILSLISSGKTSRPEIESILETPIGGYIERMVSTYGILKSIRPINSKLQSRTIRYEIVDNFLKFWFRFIHKNKSAVESANFNYLKEVIKRDYATYSGTLLEKFFHELFVLTGKYNRIGSYWEKGNVNEIDLVAINDIEKRIAFAEIKRNRENINISDLIEKSDAVLKSFKNYEPEYLALSFENIEEYL